MNKAEPFDVIAATPLIHFPIDASLLLTKKDSVPPVVENYITYPAQVMIEDILSIDTEMMHMDKTAM